MNARSFLVRTALCALIGAAAVPVVGLVALPAQAASEIRVIVNKEPVTSYQIGQRAAFLKLRRAPASAEAATDELVDETLKKQEIRRRGISIPDEQVEAAYAKFAEDNRLTAAQLGEVLSAAGFSTAGFKDYIRVQMGWGQAVQLNMRQSERLSEQDVVQRMLAQGGEKPTTTEYMLQQVIFVVPEAQRGALMETRLREANSMRQRFTSCPATFETAKGLKDVTVRDLGRVAQPELPPRWKEDITAATTGGTTKAQATERGAEFIAICSARSVSDDLAAAMVYQARDMEAMGQQEPDAAFLKKLKDGATIIRR